VRRRGYYPVGGSRPPPTSLARTWLLLFLCGFNGFFFVVVVVVVFFSQFRRQQVDEGGVEAAPRPDQHGDRAAARPAAAAGVDAPAAVAAAAHGAHLRLRPQGQLLPARYVQSFSSFRGVVTHTSELPQVSFSWYELRCTHTHTLTGSLPKRQPITHQSLFFSFGYSTLRPQGTPSPFLLFGGSLPRRVSCLKYLFLVRAIWVFDDLLGYLIFILWPTLFGVVTPKWAIRPVNPLPHCFFNI